MLGGNKVTPREKELMDLIRENPQISQADLAEKLKIKRSSVAAHIRNLTEKGEILGRGYLLRTEDYITVVGGANMDIRGLPQGTFVLEDSNPGQVQTSPGGVGRNIGENLARLGLQVSMVCVLGEDLWARELMEAGESLGLSFKEAIVIPGEQTPIYLEILNDQKEMLAAINQMDLVDRLSPDLLEGKKNTLTNAKYLVLDCNLKRESLAYLFQLGHERVVVDGVSMAKVTKIQDFLDRIYLLKVNHHEAGELAGTKIQGPEDVERVGRILMEDGPRYLVITYGKEGAWGFDGDQVLHVKTKEIKAKNATGAGDAFTAGLIYGFFQDLDFEDCLYLGQGASALALHSEKTNAEDLSKEKLIEKTKEICNG